ncbi:hypothetical protein QJS04_geneDACA011718 [Acorus gramineus]|uniref:Uncharacterized protein n=1 Tax=Acorus gramineus TaxID=55184 RepID=A0AAV9BG46_ACOGR|nr:hypothetical protein QJS04_geneDACA011718 [Acorus gramineus]
MTRLSPDQVVRDQEDRDPSSVISANLSHRALSDVKHPQNHTFFLGFTLTYCFCFFDQVSCLGGFANLERVDLSFNSLADLEGLRSCVNLKWLSVVQNKLESLRGIEGLPKLTVLNAGRNKIKSMEEVKHVTSLGALILNDNEISSICQLDKLEYLNTLVLSRNPIHDIGVSLAKAKSLTKLSLTHCKIQSIGSSIMLCSNLKEVRLSHNEITSLPVELSQNTKLRNLDLGNNLISRFSELKVISSLQSLKNLNLLGNPIAQNDKLAKEVEKLLPKLKVFNSRSIDSIDHSDTRIVHEKSKIDRSDTHIMHGKREKRAKVSAETQVEETKPKKRKADKKNPKFDEIDDADAPFMYIVLSESARDNAMEGEGAKPLGDLSDVSSKEAKKKHKARKNKIEGGAVFQFISTTDSDIGTGGPSAWDD